MQTLHAVQFGEFAVIVARRVAHHFLLGLFAQVTGIHQKQDAAGIGEFQQSIHGRNRGIRLAGAGGHLDQGARPVVFERFFQVIDGDFLTIAQTGGIKGRQSLQTATQRRALQQPFLQGFRMVEAENFARARLGVTSIGETGNRPGALIQKRQGLAIADPFQFGGGVFGGLFFHRSELVAVLFGFGFDNANWLAVDEQNVIGGTCVGLVLPNGLA